jgi:hypothetical protein
VTAGIAALISGSWMMQARESAMYPRFERAKFVEEEA